MKEFEITGVIQAGDATVDEVTDSLIAFVESKGWTFSGSIGLNESR